MTWREQGFTRHASHRCGMNDGGIEGARGVQQHCAGSLEHPASKKTSGVALAVSGSHALQ